MTEEQKKALRIVIDYLDAKMEDAPDRQLADISNYLENLAQESA
jgi:hypothetical protein